MCDTDQCVCHCQSCQVMPPRQSIPLRHTLSRIFPPSLVQHPLLPGAMTGVLSGCGQSGGGSGGMYRVHVWYLYPTLDIISPLKERNCFPAIFVPGPPIQRGCVIETQELECLLL